MIGLPQMGKTSLSKILTKANIESRGHFTPREAHLGLDKLAAQVGEAETRAWTLPLEGKDHLVKDADFLTIRHSA